MKVVVFPLLAASILMAQAGTPQDEVLRLVKEGHYAEARLAVTRLIDEAARSGAGISYRGGLFQLQGMAEYNLGSYAQAMAAFEQGIKLCEENRPASSEVLVSTLVSLAEIHTVQGRFQAGARLLQRAKSIAEADLGPDHPRVASVLDGLGALHMAQGQTSRAETAFRGSLAIIERHLGPNHPDAAMEILGLASLLLSTGRRAEAIPLLERGRKALEETYGPNHPTVVSASYYLGAAQVETAPAAAEKLLREVLKAWLATQQERHVQTALILAALASARQKQGDLGEAVALSGRALEISQDLLGPDHPQAVTLMYSHAHLLKAARRGKEAATLKKEAGRIQAKSGNSRPVQHSIDIRALRNQ